MSLIINNLKLDLGMKIMSELSKNDRFDASWSSIEKREGSTLLQLKSNYKRGHWKSNRILFNIKFYSTKIVLVL
jgi:hypothetical protein